MGQDGDGHAHFDQIWRPNITNIHSGDAKCRARDIFNDVQTVNLAK